MPLEELGSARRHDEDWIVARPVRQIFDELDEYGVGPLHVFEHHDDGALLR